MTSPILAFAIAALAASATMLGWAIAASRKTWPPRTFGVVIAIAALAMILISSVELLPTALSGLAAPAVIGLVGAGALVVLGLRIAAKSLEIGSSNLGRSALLVAVAIGLHNIPEGAAPMAATLLSLKVGIITAAAIAAHNIPEGLAVATTVMASGGSRLRAFSYTALATGGEILGAVIALVFAEALTPTSSSALLAVVAGIMITLSLVELGPSAVRLLRSPSDAITDTNGATL